MGPSHVLGAMPSGRAGVMEASFPPSMVCPLVKGDFSSSRGGTYWAGWLPVVHVPMVRFVVADNAGGIMLAFIDDLV